MPQQPPGGGGLPAATGTPCSQWTMPASLVHRSAHPWGSEWNWWGPVGLAQPRGPKLGQGFGQVPWCPALPQQPADAGHGSAQGNPALLWGCRGLGKLLVSEGAAKGALPVSRWVQALVVPTAQSSLRQYPALPCGHPGSKGTQAAGSGGRGYGERHSTGGQPGWVTSGPARSQPHTHTDRAWHPEGTTKAHGAGSMQHLPQV